MYDPVLQKTFPCRVALPLGGTWGVYTRCLAHPPGHAAAPSTDPHSPPLTSSAALPPAPSTHPHGPR